MAGSVDPLQFVSIISFKHYSYKEGMKNDFNVRAYLQGQKTAMKTEYCCRKERIMIFSANGEKILNFWTGMYKFTGPKKDYPFAGYPVQLD